jgi:hypothetical protein
VNAKSARDQIGWNLQDQLARKRNNAALFGTIDEALAELFPPERERQIIGANLPASVRSYGPSYIESITQ